jgi:hypothetical protein
LFRFQARRLAFKRGRPGSCGLKDREQALRRTEVPTQLPDHNGRACSFGLSNPAPMLDLEGQAGHSSSTRRNSKAWSMPLQNFRSPISNPKPNSEIAARRRPDQSVLATVSR